MLFRSGALRCRSFANGRENAVWLQPPLCASDSFGHFKESKETVDQNEKTRSKRKHETRCSVEIYKRKCKPTNCAVQMGLSAKGTRNGTDTAQIQNFLWPSRIQYSYLPNAKHPSATLELYSASLVKQTNTGFAKSEKKDMYLR